jgi:hypothetical protein
MADAETSTERHARRHREAETGAAVSAGKNGLVIKWGAAASAAALLLGAAWRYADARWSACEATDADLSRRATEAREHAVVLSERLVAAERRADERQADLQRQLAQIQAQLAQIQSALRGGSR